LITRIHLVVNRKVVTACEQGNAVDAGGWHVAEQTVFSHGPLLLKLINGIHERALPAAYVRKRDG